MADFPPRGSPESETRSSPAKRYIRRYLSAMGYVSDAMRWDPRPEGGYPFRAPHKVQRRSEAGHPVMIRKSANSKVIWLIIYDHNLWRTATAPSNNCALPMGCNFI